MNMIRLKILAATLVVMLLNACDDGASASPRFSVETLNAKMAESGWSYLETLGEPGESEAETVLASKTSRTVTAFWVTKGVREQKVYQQTDTLFTVVSHQKADGDTFAVVFKQPKP